MTAIRILSYVVLFFLPIVICLYRSTVIAWIIMLANVALVSLPFFFEIKYTILGWFILIIVAIAYARFDKKLHA